jgi:SAM-dependent methyltransferase
MIRLLCRSLPEAQRGGMTAVDVGCGNGRNSIALPALGFERTIAIDPSQALVTVCRQAADDAGCAIDARCGGLPSLPVDDDSANVVIAWGVMYVLGDTTSVRDAMDEIARILRPGGLLIADWRADGDYLLRFAGPRIDERTVEMGGDAPLNLAGATYSFWNGDSVKNLHDEAGFELCDMQCEEIFDALNDRKYRWWQTCARVCKS